MMNTYSVLQTALGLNLESRDLTFLHMALRCVVVFIASLVMVRFAKKRFLPHKTAFDAILFFIFASMLSRAINGSAPFFPTLGTGFVLVALHRMLAFLACKCHTLGQWIKGSETILVKEGEVVSEALRAHSLSEEDLLEELRLNGNVSCLTDVAEARYERSGEISVIKARAQK
jgi:uncharacterized membrane protein YcaP (DUF421 family)